MGFRRRTRRRAVIAGAAVAHHHDKKMAEQMQAAPQEEYAPPEQVAYAPPPPDPYAQVEHDARLAALYAQNATLLGRQFTVLDRASGSTDMGNVSLAIPSIHPFIGIESLPAVNHQHEFAAACILPPADRAIVDGAVAMAWTALDVAGDESERARLLEPN